MSPRLELRLFGQPCVLREGRVVALAARKGLALLAVLALQGLVPRERMAVLLWPAVDVGAARRNLRRELFRLREVGLPLGGAAGALLQLSDAWSVDVLRFRSAADAAALDLWLQAPDEDACQEAVLAAAMTLLHE